MLSKTNNNYCKPNHLVDDWGFYIDLESIQPIPNNEEKIRQKYKVKKYSIYDKYNEYCNDVCDEYSYYMKNNNNRDDDYSIDVSMIDTNTELIKDNTAKNSKNVNNIIVRVSSTTIITAFLTYVIFFVL